MTATNTTCFQNTEALVKQFSYDERAQKAKRFFKSPAYKGTNLESCCNSCEEGERGIK